MTLAYSQFDHLIIVITVITVITVFIVIIVIIVIIVMAMDFHVVFFHVVVFHVIMSAKSSGGDCFEGLHVLQHVSRLLVTHLNGFLRDLTMWYLAQESSGRMGGLDRTLCYLLHPLPYLARRPIKHFYWNSVIIQVFHSNQG
jgi:hypothetical protein